MSSSVALFGGHHQVPLEAVSVVWKRRNNAAECPRLGTAMVRALVPVDEIPLVAVITVRRVVVACCIAKTFVSDADFRSAPNCRGKNQQSASLRLQWKCPPFSPSPAMSTTTDRAPAR